MNSKRSNIGGSATEIWPALPLNEWRDTCDTLHMWTQVVGKVKLELCPFVNEWWEVALHLTARGLTTSTIPFARGVFEIDFDFVDHSLYIRSSDGEVKALPLKPRSVADFYAEFMAALRTLGVEANLNTRPQQFKPSIPFEKDQEHAAYDPVYVDRWWRILTQVGVVMEKYRAGFSGKSSPVQFYWGDFDLCQTRSSGKPSEPPKGANRRERFTADEENVTAGFWPGGAKYGKPAFYSYMYPSPRGYTTATVRPAAARFDAKLGEFVLDYDDVRRSAAPEKTILDFLPSTYEAGAALSHWDRGALERPGPDVGRNLGAKVGTATDDPTPKT
ncbi:MAG: DUF5996 family protein [Acidobacteriota bacterium]|nr:DUF5996 family protein [Acidobacteriota bacterium]